MSTATATRRAAGQEHHAGNHRLAGTSRLIRLALRLDRVRIPVWALAIGGLICYFALVLPEVN